jgi:hypothetical protein
MGGYIEIVDVDLFYSPPLMISFLLSKILLYFIPRYFLFGPSVSSS